MAEYESIKLADYNKAFASSFIQGDIQPYKKEKLNYFIGPGSEKRYCRRTVSLDYADSVSSQKLEPWRIKAGHTRGAFYNLVGRRNSTQWVRKSYIILDDFNIIIPVELRHLIDVIEESKYILELKDNWDDEGSKSYELQTWKMTISFLIDYSLWIYGQTSKIIRSPEIVHGKNGRIELQWRNETFRLAIRIESDNATASFYGDNYGGHTAIKGQVDLTNIKTGLALAIADLF